MTDSFTASAPRDTATTNGPAVLEDQLCFALYAASRAVTGLYRKGLAEIGLTYPQYIVLLRLWQQDGSTVSELGDALALDSGTLSPIIKRLKLQGLIRKERGIDDERVVTIWCTGEGWALEEPAAHVRNDVECATGLSEADMTHLRESLTKLRSHIAD